MKLLKFSKIKNNAKLAHMGNGAYSFSLPAGHSCPFANACLSKADPKTGKITDGPNNEFRCFSASTEAIFPAVRRQRWYNFRLFKKTRNQTMLIAKSIPNDAKIIRWFVSGDFYSEDLFKAVINVARMYPKIVYYAYTKSTPWLIKYKDEIPKNLRFTASYGGKLDNLIEQHDLKSAKVVFHPNEAKELGLKIDHDDSLAINSKKSFALLLHGKQAAKSEASLAQSVMRKEGIEFAYKSGKHAEIEKH